MRCERRGMYLVVNRLASIDHLHPGIRPDGGKRRGERGGEGKDELYVRGEM